MTEHGGVFKLVMRVGAKVETWRFRRSGGTSKFMGNEQLLLTTVGRKSGKERTTPLFFGRDGDRLIVIASFGGSDTHPAWYLNLRDRGEGWVELGKDKFRVTPQLLEGEERERNWRAMSEFWPDYDKYTTKTSRTIPVVALVRN
ncbi:nitroreductase family deazaflavin-dependent oxidoreductase [Hoyosella subflava]|uniref:Deazaflavin-dependent nitroreductase family protein n=1 Tax=Hoyosella subflava (strain DSM 45089 / JCM 17490 / NBRC 109087 / DQS3-9A1) TaxID=443218 RepID=F6EEZ6_HOYSD|nr:nitroreductase family deazaflavin-dependent oxidoreductase [Hoyosella subflava]AEF42133.1 hypothetical protein AS9A_3695 [Hoyosella subflava DQS3-9A1]